MPGKVHPANAEPVVWPPHVELMLRACGSIASPEPDGRLPTLASHPELDWHELLAVTLNHRVLPHVVRSLQFCGPAGAPACIPPPVWRQMQQRLQVNQHRAARGVVELELLGREFHRAGLPLAFLKGTGLSRRLYGSATFRHLGDLDLLTRPEEMPRKAALLESLGYCRTHPACRMSAVRMRRYQRHWKDLSFAHPEKGFAVDLHWRLFNNPHHPGNRLPALAPGSGTDAVLCPAGELLYLAAQGAADRWVYLKGLADVAAALHRLPPAEWDTARRLAAELGMLPVLSSAVHLAREWMGAPAVPSLLPGLLAPAEPRHAAMRAEVLGRLQAERFRPRRKGVPWYQEMRLEMEATAGLGAGLRTGLEVGRRFFWRPRVWQQVDLPDRLFWAYPAVAALLPPRSRPASDPGR